MSCLLYSILVLAYLFVGLFVYSVTIYTGEVDDNIVIAILIVLFFPVYLAYILLRDAYRRNNG